MRRRIVAAILADTADVLLPWAGSTRLRSIAQQVCAASCERVAVVLGTSAGSIAGALAGLPITTLPNVLWSDGVSAGVRCAVAWALRSGADGLLLVDGEQARVDRAHVDSLLSAFRNTRAPVASHVRGEVGLPAVFGIESFPRLGQLTGGRDSREVLRTTSIVKAVPWPEGSIERAIDVAIQGALDSALDGIIATAIDIAAPAAIPDLGSAPEVFSPNCPA